MRTFPGYGCRAAALRAAWHSTGRAAAKRKTHPQWVRFICGVLIELGVSLAFGGSLFGHGLLHLLATLLAGFGALRALLVEKLFSAQQLDECFFGSIAALEAGANDAQVAALAI